MTFKFDFAHGNEACGHDIPIRSSSSTDGEGRIMQTLNADVTASANENIISRLMHRCKTSVEACTLWNASCKQIMHIVTHDNGGSSKSNVHYESMGPQHEKEGTSSNIDMGTFIRHHKKCIHLSTPHTSNSNTASEMLYYVIPKHTLANATTDLIPGVYEGGLKVWECSIDLCQFLVNIIRKIPATTVATSISKASSNDIATGDFHDFITAAVQRCIESEGVTLELGCGHGLPGCLILRESIRRSMERAKLKKCRSLENICDDHHHSMVIFSDFNDFVLHRATIPNANLNVGSVRNDSEGEIEINQCFIAGALLKRSMFVGGDWMGLSEMLANGILSTQRQHTTWKSDEKDIRLDLILASETTYTPESCEDTAFLMMRHLKIEIGVGLVATKRFYFGVGGGTDMFIDVCKTLSMRSDGKYSDLRLCVRRAQCYDVGNANIRDLLEVRCRRK